MKLIISEFEADAIKYCAELLSRERCIISVVHQSKRSDWSYNMCSEAFNAQHSWEIYRAYKDFNMGHTPDYLGYPADNEELVAHMLAAYLQIKYIIGIYSELVYPEKYYNVCSKIKGKIDLIAYPQSHQKAPLPTDIEIIQRKALGRFKSVII